MRVLIVGAGAIGGVLAAMLSPYHEVDVMVRGDRIRQIGSEGITVRGAVECTAHPGVRPEGLYRAVFIATKAYDVGMASREVREHVGDGSIVISLQNGLRHVGVLDELFGGRVVLAPTTLGATANGPSEISLVTAGLTIVGSPSGRGGPPEEVSRMLNQAGLWSRTSNKIIDDVWTKAIVNACINPLAALMGVPNGLLLERAPLLTLAERACSEAVMAAKANGAVPTHRDMFTWVKDVMRSTSLNRCSMLQDLEAGRRTEIDEINGELVRKGEARGISMAVNRSLWTMVRVAEGRPAT